MTYNQIFVDVLFKRLWTTIPWVVLCCFSILGTIVKPEPNGDIVKEIGRTLLGLVVLAVLVAMVWAGVVKYNETKHQEKN